MTFAEVLGISEDLLAKMLENEYLTRTPILTEVEGEKELGKEAEEI